jgi:hypothetical protein
MRVAQVAIREMRQKSRPTDGGGADKLRSPKERRLLTEFISMFRPDSGHNSVRERGSPLWLRLFDELRNANPALALARRLRRVLREALQQADGGSLEVLHDVGRGRRVCVRRWIDNVKTGERECVGVCVGGSGM